MLIATSFESARASTCLSLHRCTSSSSSSMSLDLITNAFSLVYASHLLESIPKSYSELKWLCFVISFLILRGERDTKSTF
jgi:hypothetical protein